LGAPYLPVARASIATGADGPTLIFVGTSDVVIVKFGDLRPLPTFSEGMDEDFDPSANPGPGDTLGSAPARVYDAAVYGLQDYRPADNSAARTPVEALFAPINGASVAIYPVRYNPDTEVVDIGRTMTLTYSVNGTTAGLATITKPTSVQPATPII